MAKAVPRLNARDGLAQASLDGARLSFVGDRPPILIFCLGFEVLELLNHAMMFFCQSIDCCAYELFFDKLSGFCHNNCAKVTDLGGATLLQFLYLSLVPLIHEVLLVSATFLWHIFNLTSS